MPPSPKRGTHPGSSTTTPKARYPPRPGEPVPSLIAETRPRLNTLKIAGIPTAKATIRITNRQPVEEPGPDTSNTAQPAGKQPGDEQADDRRDPERTTPGSCACARRSRRPGVKQRPAGTHRSITAEGANDGTVGVGHHRHRGSPALAFAIPPRWRRRKAYGRRSASRQASTLDLVTAGPPRSGRRTAAPWFSFVVVSAVLIHHGSSESRDGTERIERSVEEIRTMLPETGLPQRTTR
jgi:hypothetical protein